MGGRRTNALGVCRGGVVSGADEAFRARAASLVARRIAVGTAEAADRQAGGIREPAQVTWRLACMRWSAVRLGWPTVNAKS